MEHLSREDCELYKALGGPQEGEGYWYILDDPAGRPFFGYVDRPDIIFADADGVPIVRQATDCLACPHWGDVLTFLRDKGYIISLSLATDCLIVVASQDEGRVRPYVRENTPVEAVSALLKAVAEREKVDA